MLHPCTWSFPCWLVKQMSCLWASWVKSQDRSGFSRVRYGSTKDQEHWGRWCTCRALSLSSWLGTIGPAHGKQKGFVVLEQVLGAVSRWCRVTWIIESPHAPLTHPPPPRWKKKSVAISHSCTFFLVVSAPPCFHLVFADSSVTPLVPGSEFGSTLLSRI